jgi:hypothetical protein
MITRLIVDLEVPRIDSEDVGKKRSKFFCKALYWPEPKTREVNVDAAVEQLQVQKIDRRGICLQLADRFQQNPPEYSNIY